MGIQRGRVRVAGECVIRIMTDGAQADGLRDKRGSGFVEFSCTWVVDSILTYDGLGSWRSLGIGRQ